MKFGILLLGVFLSVSTTLFSQEQDYLWPTSASPYLSSTFGETRAAHFHAGIDIKTWGREGYRVFATKDGIIHRIGIFARGYGRVIYLKHTDGTYSVYAHLQRFRDDIQSYVDSVRMINHQFEIDLEVHSLNIQVGQGEVIGYTGSTGIGPPHLHFEIRNEHDEPINPLLTNLAVPDNIPPRISSLQVFPLSDSTLIEGVKSPRIYYPEGNTRIPIQASGPIGLAVSVSDGANEVTNRYAVFELGLAQQEDTLFYQKIDQFNFEETETMFLDRYPAPGQHQRSYQKLFKTDGPEIPFHEIIESQSIIIPQDSTSTYEVFAKDIYGNTTKIHVEVIRSSATGLGTTEIRPPHKWHWTEDWVTHTGFSAMNLEQFDFGIEWDSSSQQQILPHGESLYLFDRILPEKHSRIRTPDQNLQVHFTPNTFFDTLTVALTTGFIDEQHYIAIHPASKIARKNYKVEYYFSKNFNPEVTYQLFKIDRNRDRLIHMDSYMIGRTLHGWPDEIGEFLVLPDSTGPELSSPSIKETSYGTWVVEISAIDSLSGINYQESSIIVNGKKGITEYDFEEDKLIYIHPGFTPKKENIIQVTAKDKAGNHVTSTYQM
ncbi:MAG: M23 family metallopeptidase [Balneolales bacterium]|nr:M23 family metallopeptidase [Balneolales bacterium]